MSRPSIDTLAPTTETDLVDSFASDPGLLYWVVTPGDADSFTVFDGATLRHDTSDEEWSVYWTPGSEFTDGAVIEVIGFGGPTPPAPRHPDGSLLPQIADGVEVADATEGWRYTEERGGSIFIRVGAAATTIILDR